MIGKSLITTW